MSDEVEVEEKDEIGVTIIRRASWPGRLHENYKEKRPSPRPKRFKRKRKAAELEEQSKALFELTVVETSPLADGDQGAAGAGASSGRRVRRREPATTSYITKTPR